MADNGDGVGQEVYTERNILFRTEDTGALLYGMVGYLAGNGSEPQPGHEVILDIQGPAGYTHREGRKVEIPRRRILSGVFEVVEVKDSDIDSPYYNKPEEDAELPEEHKFWGVTIRKIREVETVDEIDRIERAGLVSMM